MAFSLLSDLAKLVRSLPTRCRHEHKLLPGQRRRGGSIAHIADPEAIVLYRPGMPGETPEDGEST